MLKIGLTGLVFLVLVGGVNALILRGLRAPRLGYQQTPQGPSGPAQELRLRTPTGKSIVGWLVPADGTAPAPAVVVMHGWGANASLMQACVAPLCRSGMSVLLLDARCHGRSDGEAFTSLPRFAQDIGAGLDWLRNQSFVDSDRLALIGHSVGAGAALYCACQRTDVRAVVSLSAFAHPRDVMVAFLAEHRIPYPVIGSYVLWFVQRVIGHRFDDIAPIRSIGRLTCPVLLVHGRQDEMVPLSDAHRLMSAGKQGSVNLLEVCGRHDLTDALDAHVSEITSFLRSVLSPLGDRAGPAGALAVQSAQVVVNR